MRISRIEQNGKEMTVYVSKSRGKTTTRRTLEKLEDLSWDKETVHIIGEDVDPIDPNYQRQIVEITFFCGQKNTLIHTGYKLEDIEWSFLMDDWIWGSRLATPEKEYDWNEIYKERFKWKVTYDNWLGQEVWERKEEKK